MSIEKKNEGGSKQKQFCGDLKDSEQDFDHQKPKNDIHKSEHLGGLDMCVLYQDVGGQIFG